MMVFVTHEEGIERTCALVESERGEAATHLRLLVAARLLAAEVRRLRERDAKVADVVQAWRQYRALPVRGDLADALDALDALAATDGDA